MSAHDSPSGVRAHPAVDLLDRIGEQWKSPIARDIYHVIGVLSSRLRVRITSAGGSTRLDTIAPEALSSRNGWIFIRRMAP
jgi:hypothetical protein